MDENDRDYLRMIWFDNVLSTNSTMKLLRFTRLVFGLTSSPFILNRTVKIHLDKVLSDNQKKDVIIILLTDLYADHVTTSFDSINEGIQFYEISKSCLLKGQFALRKLVTNYQKLQLFIDAKENENIAQNGNYRKLLGFY